MNATSELHVASVWHWERAVHFPAQLAGFSVPKKLSETSKGSLVCCGLFFARSVPMKEVQLVGREYNNLAKRKQTEEAE